MSFRALLAGWIGKTEAGEAAVSPNDGLCHSSHRLSLVRKPLGRSTRGGDGDGYDGGGLFPPKRTWWLLDEGRRGRRAAKSGFGK